MNDRKSNTAEEFLASIEPTGHLWHDDDMLKRWVFRGQASDKWDLRPSALRDDVVLMSKQDKWDTGLRKTLWEQLEDEVRTITQFFNLADQVGIPMSVDHRNMRYMLSTWKKSHDEFPKEHDHYWPPDEILPVLALAQHHGIPTRLLDFTYSSHIAAYFAASDAAIKYQRDLLTEEDDLIVWAVNMQHIIMWGESENDVVVRIVSTPGFGNHNLVLQRGLFILVKEKEDGLNEPPKKTSLLDYPTGFGSNSKNQLVTVIDKHTLPVSQAGTLLRLLHQQHQVSAEKLFQGVDGVVKSLRERDYWDISSWSDES